MAKHLGALAVLWIAMSGLRLLTAGGIFALGRARFINFEPSFGPVPFLHHMFSMMSAVLFVCAIVGIAAGVGLLQRRPWARMLALIVAALALFDPPFGTAVGIYTLWVLLPSGSEDEYRNLARAV